MYPMSQSKVMNVIDSKKLEGDAGGKAAQRPTFPHPTLEHVLVLEKV